jgi:hypothetical protein
MREIKSRGKRLDNGEWVYGYYVKFHVHHYIVIVIALVPEEYNWVEVIPETVGHFTGHRDKKGQEIYEDSIIAFKVHEKFGIIAKDNLYKGKVYFCEKRLALCVDSRPAWDMPIAHNLIYIEVIGDIHTTPELLEKEK